MLSQNIQFVNVTFEGVTPELEAIALYIPPPREKELLGDRELKEASFLLNVQFINVGIEEVLYIPPPEE